MEILFANFGPIWSTFWPYEKDLFLKFAIGKIRKFPYAKITFFPKHAIAYILNVLHSKYTWDTPCRVWSTLENFMI